MSQIGTDAAPTSVLLTVTDTKSNESQHSSIELNTAGKRANYSVGNALMVLNISDH